MITKVYQGQRLNPLTLHLYVNHERAKHGFREFSRTHPAWTFREIMMQAVDPDGNVHLFSSAQNPERLLGLEFRGIITHDDIGIPDRLKPYIRS
jgi:hypothetical protein